jgi:uncharacterized membrane protein (UPF0127 family)
MRNLLLVAITLISAMVVVSLTSTACPLTLPTATISIKGHLLTVELATTPSARVCGLSQRSELQQDRGMLFIFPDNRPRNFWMKNTYIPLSIAYMNDAGRILNIHDMVPLQVEQQYPSVQPASYALEVKQGWFRQNGIVAGDVVEMKLPLVLDIR